MRCSVAARGRGSAGSDDDQESGGLLVAVDPEWDDREPLTWDAAVRMYGLRWARALEVGGMVVVPEARPDGWVDVSPRFVAGPRRGGGEW
jgi:hypothetical protein